MKKTIPLLLLCMMLFCCFSPGLFADDTVTVKGQDGVLPLNITTTNGSLNSMKLTDKNGDSMDFVADIITGSSKTTINITIPRSYGFGCVINTECDLTQSETVTYESGGKAYKLPLLSQSRYGSWCTDSNVKSKWKNSIPSSGSTSNSGSCYLADKNSEGSIIFRQIYVNYKLENNAPSLIGGTGCEATITAGETYSLDLATVFKDDDADDTLKYTVTANGTKILNNSANSIVSYAPTVGGYYTLICTAQDRMKANSESYTVKLMVKNSSVTYDVKVVAPENTTFYATAMAESGTEIAATRDENGIYTVRVPENISTISWRCDGMGGSADVSKENNNLKLVKTEYVVKADDAVDSGATVTVTPNGVGKNNTFLLSDSGSYTVKATPSADYKGGWKDTTLKEQKAVEGKVEIVLDTKELTFTLPRNASMAVCEVSSKQGLAPKTVAPNKTTPGFGNVQYSYILENGKVYEYRVTSTNSTDVTYVGMFTKTALSENITITADQLGDGEHEKTTIIRDMKDFEGTGSLAAANVADLYLNGNTQGYLKLEKEGSYDIVAARAWWATSGGGWSMNGYNYVEPDYHYSVVDLNGETSEDVISVDARGRITAKGEGTAIVLVTYDAMNVAMEESLYKGCEKPTPNGFYGAIWPENTGVLVVSVGAKDSDIDTGMTINEDKTPEAKVAGKAIDAELDVIYFVGENGEYTFTPGTKGVSVSVANPEIGDNVLSFSGFRKVVANRDGSFSVPLTNGRNIVKLEKRGKVEYQVITAKSVDVTINNTPLEDAFVAPGDKVVVKFDTLYNPMNRMAIYNTSAATVYSDISGYEGRTAGSARGAYGFYFFASSSSCQTISNFNKHTTDGTQYENVIVALDDELIVPENYTGSCFTLSDGTFNIGGFSNYKAGEHRAILGQDTPKNTLISAGLDLYLGRLPDISIPVADLESISVTKEPAVMNYSIGDTFDPTDMEVTATYVYGNEEVERTVSGYTCDTSAFTSAGTKDVTVSYTLGDVTKTTTVEVTVSETELEKIELTKAPDKSFYRVGETFDPAGMVITAVYDNGTEKEVTAYRVSSDALTAKTDFVEVTYGNKSVKVDVTMNLVERIAITEVPDKIDYVEGDIFDAVGMEVTAYYKDGSAVVTDQIRYTPQTVLHIDDTFVTVNYTGDDAVDAIAAVQQEITVAKATETDGITVTMSFVDKGAIVVYNVPVFLSGKDNDQYTIADAFKALHREYCPEGENGYSENKGWVTEFWNGDIDGFCYTYNNGWVMSTEQNIANGDCIAAFNGQDMISYADLYTWFDKKVYNAVVNTDVAFTVHGLNIMNSTEERDYIAAPKGANVTVYDRYGKEVSGLSTTVDENGSFTLVFPEVGTYTVEVSGTASYAHYKNAPIVPSRCNVTVNAAAIIDPDIPSEPDVPTNPDAPKVKFDDVKEGDYFYEAVSWAVKNDITNGMGNNCFEPDGSCTRAQMITFLWRAAGQPNATITTCAFTDVSEDAWYYKALLWAVEKGIVKGMSEDIFGMDVVCTRAQMITFFYRYHGSPLVSGKQIFTDVNEGDYFYNAVRWATQEELTNGMGNNAFCPGFDCTRAQIVVMLYRDFALK